MKKLFLKRETAITVLIIIALAAIPVFGGMKLNAAYERTFVSFEKDGRQVDKYGNSLVSDIEQCAAAAGDVLALAKPYIEAKPQLYETAEKALAELNSAESVFERYEAYGRVIATLKPVYELALDAGKSLFFRHSSHEVNPSLSNTRHIYFQQSSLEVNPTPSNTGSYSSVRLHVKSRERFHMK